MYFFLKLNPSACLRQNAATTYSFIFPVSSFNVSNISSIMKGFYSFLTEPIFVLPATKKPILQVMKEINP